MSLETVIDNDVLIKLSCYAILADLLAGLGEVSSAGILGVARYVVNDRLNRHPGIEDRQKAKEHWAMILEAVQQLEPTEIEVDFATSIEELAIIEGLQLDGGESQLCAITIMRGVPRLVTGDKRAIRAVESMIAKVGQLRELLGRVACLEQAVMTVVDRIGACEVRNRVCAEQQVDRAITICFECESPNASNSGTTGLNSYINDLRSDAPNVLAQGGLVY